MCTLGLMYTVAPRFISLYVALENLSHKTQLLEFLQLCTLGLCLISSIQSIYKMCVHLGSSSGREGVGGLLFFYVSGAEQRTLVLTNESSSATHTLALYKVQSSLVE